MSGSRSPARPRRDAASGRPISGPPRHDPRGLSARGPRGHRDAHAGRGHEGEVSKGLVVQNRPGAAGSLAVSEITRSAPDGYTIALTPPLGTGHRRADQQRGLQDARRVRGAFANVVDYYPMIAVRAESPYKTIQDLVADAKANPSKVRVSSPGEGTSSHLNLEELVHKTVTKMIHVPYQGWGRVEPGDPRRGASRPWVAQPGELKAHGGRQAHARAPRLSIRSATPRSRTSPLRASWDGTSRTASGT